MLVGSLSLQLNMLVGSLSLQLTKPFGSQVSHGRHAGTCCFACQCRVESFSFLGTVSTSGCGARATRFISKMTSWLLLREGFSILAVRVVEELGFCCGRFFGRSSIGRCLEEAYRFWRLSSAYEGPRAVI